MRKAFHGGIYRVLRKQVERSFIVKLNKRVTALLLMIVLVIASVPKAARAESDRLTEYEHERLDFKKVEYEHVETDDLEIMISGLAELSKNETNKDEVEKNIGIIEEKMNKLQDMGDLVNYLFTKNSQDEYYTAEHQYVTVAFQTMSSLYIEALKEVCVSPCKDAVKKYYSDEDIKEILKMKVPTPEEIACSEKHQMLLAEYYAFKPEIDIMGTSYTYEKFMEAYMAGEFSDFILALYYPKFSELMKQDAVRIYFQMIENNTKLAKLNGYDNYMDYAFKTEFQRDYTPDEMKVSCDSILEKTIPYFQLFESYNSSWLTEKVEEGLKGGITNILGKYMEKLAPEFKESYDFMMDTNALEIIPVGSSPISFTSMLRSHAFPFICMNEYGDGLSEMSTLFHEFGHYNAFYWRDLKNTGMLSLDLEETYSQGMELLVTKYYDEIYKGAGESAEKRLLGRMLSVLFEGALISEIEYTAYTGGYKTEEELAEAIDNVIGKYLPPEVFMWTAVPHIFEAPGYYISYVMSALNALELYIMSKEDFDKALDAYFELIKDVELPYKEVLEKAGIPSDFTTESMNGTMDKLLELYIDTDAPEIFGVEDKKTYSEPVDIEVKDAAGLYISLINGSDEQELTQRSFTVGGANGTYELTVIDSFNNYSSVTFSVEPIPFTIEVEAVDAGHNLSWTRIAGADYYKVYGAELGGKYKLLGKTKDCDFTNTETGEKIWKYYVKAYKKTDGKSEKLAKSYKSFAVTEDNSVYTNADSIDITVDSVLLESGENQELTVVEELEETSKKQFSGKKVKAVRYISSDDNIAKVSSKGVVTAKGEGECYIYCIAENGLTDKVTVKVS